METLGKVTGPRTGSRPHGEEGKRDTRTPYTLWEQSPRGSTWQVVGPLPGWKHECAVTPIGSATHAARTPQARHG